MSNLQWAWGMQAKRRVPYHEAKRRAAEKKAQEEEETAAAYADFVESFQEEATQESTFVKGETISQPNGSGAPVVHKSSAPSSLTLKMTRGKAPKPGLFDDPDEEPMPKKSSKQVKVKAIDALLEEMKSAGGKYAAGDNRSREYERRDVGELPDQSDPNTTNLYVGNIAANADEETLQKMFGQYGTITSIKIMWPRKDEERGRQHNCGFVSFSLRRDAERAKQKLDGYDFMGSSLKIDWSKPVKAVGVPMVMAPNAKEAVLAQLKAGPGGFSDKSSKSGFSSKASSDPPITVELPKSRSDRKRVDAAAKLTARHGYEFQALLMEKEYDSADYKFLFDRGTALYNYYCWRCWSFAQGDSDKKWKTDKFQMVSNSTWWVPPAMPEKEDRRDERDDGGREERRSRYTRDEKTLSDRQFDEFTDLLRAISISRQTIKAAMVYALDHAEYSGDIVKCIKEALTLGETAPVTKVARLYLVSDILHNSSAPVKNASSYRSGFESVLRPIIKSFREVYLEQGRMSASVLNDQVLQVLEVWDRWSLYPSHFIQELVAIFEGREVAPRPNDDIDGVPLDDLDGAPIDGMDMDGEPVDGEEMDGDVLTDDEDLDGEPLAGASGLGPDLRLLPQSELQNLCRQAGLPTDGKRDALLDRIITIDLESEPKRQKTS